MSSRPTSEHQVARPPFGAPHVFVLAVIDGAPPHRVHRIERSETVIGREQGVDFLLDDQEISKRHCVLRADGPVCTVTDLGSLNGTRLNGRPLRDGVAQRLRHLDQIQLGTTCLFFLAGKFRTPSVKD
ncbi:MAG TPA: FHA domain-containing protein [Candidatus Polarisedimenticolaceae bacterium]|nr:FHA domain-containing protein [Candidatus Polarisedimenticolaceae bacterium]